MIIIIIITCEVCNITIVYVCMYMNMIASFVYVSSIVAHYVDGYTLDTLTAFDLKPRL